MTGADLFGKAFARNTDPFTSHKAARRVDITRGQKKVLKALQTVGPSTQEEVGDFYKIASDTIGPRFKPLRLMNRIRALLDNQGTVITRKGRSGRQRIVWEIQPDPSLYRPLPEKRTRAQLYRTALEEIRDLVPVLWPDEHRPITEIIERVTGEKHG